MEHEAIILVIKFLWQQLIYSEIEFYGKNGQLAGEIPGIDSEDVLRLGNNTEGKISHGNLERQLLAY